MCFWENHYWKIKEEEQEGFRSYAVLPSVTLTALLTATDFLIYWLIYYSFSMKTP